MLFSSLFSVVALDFGRMQNALSQRFGAGAVTSLQNWQKLLTDNAGQPVLVQVSQVNTFFNRSIRFDDDRIVWGQSEYWATPMETLGKGAGDCEDFAIVKYFTLLQLGIPDERLRLIYVNARVGGAGTTTTQAHMVLAFYPAANTEPLILDNLKTEVQPASRRPDLLPVFSFNGQGIWQGVSGARGPGGPASLSRWQDLLQRARAEGF